MIDLNIYLNKIVLALSICLMLLFTIGWMFAPTSDLANVSQLEQDIHSLSDFDNIGVYEKREVSESDVSEQSDDNSVKNTNSHPKKLVQKIKLKSNANTSKDKLQAKVETVIELDDFEDDSEYYYAEEDIPFIELDGSIVVSNDKYY